MSFNEQLLMPMLNLLRRRRNELRYSQEYMAAKTDCTQKGYSKLELGFGKLTVDKFLVICDILELLPADLFEQIETEKLLITT